MIIPILAFGAGPITSNRYSDSLIGSTGSGASFATSFGQLYFSSSRGININVADTWFPIPFNAFGPSNNVDGTITSPATLTILQSGVYQLNVSLYFAVEDSLDEGIFSPTTYLLGTSVNGGTTTAVAGVHVPEATVETLNYNVLQTFSVNDTVQFYIQSNVGGPFNDQFAFISGSAYLVQIGD